MDEKKIVIWGAGRIGRGFIGDLFTSAGYQIAFIDEAQSLVDGLNQNKKYMVVRAVSKDQIEYIDIKDYSIFHTSQVNEIQESINSASIMAIGVFPQNFEAVAKQLQKHLKARRLEGIKTPFDILLCTNLIHAGPKFEKFLYEGLEEGEKQYFSENIGVIETLVIRICPDPPKEFAEQHPFVVWTNGYFELPVDKNGFRGPIPKTSFLRIVENMRAEEIRKIYTYNMCHAVLAFHGHMMGYQTLVECLSDDYVRKEAEGALNEISEALQKEYGFTPEEMEKWISGVFTHTDNPAIGDTVVRSAADPIRKLSRDDRIIGPILLCIKNGISPKYLQRAVAAALNYKENDDAASEKLAQSIQDSGIRQTIIEFCGLSNQEEDLIAEIISEYEKLPLEVDWQKKAVEAWNLGFKYEKVYHGCGQCVIAAATEVLGIFDENVFNSATGLCGGIGLVNEATCSSFSGGAMVIGMMFHRGRDHFDGDRENKYINFDLIQQLREKFLKKYGTITCGQIHTKIYGRSYDLRSKEEREKFEEAGGHGDHGCTEVVADAAKWTTEIILNEINKQL